MADYQILKEAVAAVIKDNGNNEITGDLMQSTLFAIINTLGTGYQFAGVADAAVVPGTPDAKLFYVAKGPGTYLNFNNLVVNDGELAFFFIPSGYSSWYKMAVPLVGSGFTLYSPERFNVAELPARPTDGKKYYLIAYRIVSNSIYREYLYTSQPLVDGGMWHAERQINNIEFVPNVDSYTNNPPNTITPNRCKEIIELFFPSWKLNFPQGTIQNMSGSLQDFLTLFNIQDLELDFLAYFTATTAPRIIVQDRDQTQGNLLILPMVAFEHYDDVYHINFGSMGSVYGMMFELYIELLNGGSDINFTLEVSEI